MNNENHSSDNSIQSSKAFRSNAGEYYYLALSYSLGKGARCMLLTWHYSKNAVFCIHLLQCIEWNEDPEHTGTFCSMIHFHMW